MPTKAELEYDLDASRKRCNERSIELGKEKDRVAQLESSNDRLGRISAELDSRMRRASAAIETALAMKYGKSPFPSGEWVSGQYVEDGVTDEVRLLRFLYEINTPPKVSKL